MKRILLFLCLGYFSLSAYAQGLIPKAIYGDDSRLDVLNHPNDEYQDWARATAARFSPSRLRKSHDGDYYRVAAPSLAASMRLCSDERFASQPSASDCSGFLISDKLLVTAGHCMQSQADCRSHFWVFDYFARGEDDSSITISAENVYTCQSIVRQKLNRTVDYAVIELDRAVKGRPSLSMRQSGQIQNGEPLLVIGYPSGLPAKIADQGVVLTNRHQNYFNAQLDTFGGSSGSPVINQQTGLVEGILVRGARDYRFNHQKGCTQSYVCSQFTCGGEGVTRITEIFR